MKVTFIYPSVGHSSGTKYIRSWQMQPLAIAALSALTPSSWDKVFFDDRMERINFDLKTNLAAISIETFTAKRGYQIAGEYRKRGVPVVMGGYHATFCPDEVLEHADAVCVGEAEGVWPSILADAERHNLSKRYICESKSQLFSCNYDRSIFSFKNYFKLALVEAGRGCHYRCKFCSISAFHAGKYKYRPVEEVINEIRCLKEKVVFFIDDNITASHEHARKLFVSLKNLNIKWIGQADINAASDGKLLDLMAESGCIGLLIGFETLKFKNLSYINKCVNKNTDYSRALKELRKRGIAVYGTFLLGLPSDSEKNMEKSIEFAIRGKLFIAAFNHLIPFPGTPLYNELQEENRLIYDKWWLNENYRFGEVPFNPVSTSSYKLQEWCHKTRNKFYGVGSIMRRFFDFDANCNSFQKIMAYFGINFLLKKEILQRRGLPLGEYENFS